MTFPQATLLLVEDDAILRQELIAVFREAELSFKVATHIGEAQKLFAEQNFALTLCDFQLPDGTGLDLLYWLRAKKLITEVYLMSAYANVNRAVEAVKAGAVDFFEKPLALKSLVVTLKKALTEKKISALANYTLSAEKAGLIFAPDSPLIEALRLATLMANKNSAVHLTGESGSGKELFARFLHAQSDRKNQPFIAVNCGAIPSALIESELFGVRKGAFTGAQENRMGKFQMAQGGTLFLDEIGELPLNMQTKLLRVLQEKKVCPVGGDEEVSLDFHLLSATHKNLLQEVELGHFREDLFYRVQVLTIDLPPLRDRPQDIPLILEKKLKETLSATEVQAALQTATCLQDYAFPGNIRELLNITERYLVLKEMGKDWSDAIPHLAKTNKSLPKSSASSSSTSSSSSSIRNSFIPDNVLLAALENCGFHRSKAAAKLGISRRALQYRLAKLGVSKNVSE